MIYYYPNRPFLLNPNSPKVREFSNHPDWDAEIKKNGTRLELRKTTRFEFLNRHKKVLKYSPCKELLAELQQLNVPKDTQLDGELMHFKVKGIKDIIVFYDVYILGGRNVREELKYRREMLHDIFRGKTFNHIQISEVYESNFESMFDRVIEQEENEGLVLKNKKGKIVWNPMRSPDVHWQFKIRRPHKNYSF